MFSNHFYKRKSTRTSRSKSTSNSTTTTISPLLQSQLSHFSDPSTPPPMYCNAIFPPTYAQVKYPYTAAHFNNRRGTVIHGNPRSSECSQLWGRYIEVDHSRRCFGG